MTILGPEGLTPQQRDQLASGSPPYDAETGFRPTTTIERLEGCLGANHQDALDLIAHLQRRCRYMEGIVAGHAKEIAHERRMHDDSKEYISYLEQVLKNAGVTP